MNKSIGSTIVGLIGTLFFSGCAANSTQPTQAPSQTPVKNVTVEPTPSTSTNWRYVGTDDFLLQGKITGVDTAIQAIKLKTSNITPNGPLRSPTPKLPYPSGSIVTIYFKHPLPAKGMMKPVVGEAVKVWVDQYTVGTNHASFLGSEMAHGFYFKKNGKYINSNGEQPVVTNLTGGFYYAPQCSTIGKLTDQM
ncbi:hypothetical protein [Alicyclobacillus sp. SO9]|uniref:hypothetical protein n=1 Tax=Alicyclobacillus sp. SO9 TaxID=2665646 RepID=UPI0018E8AD11|nr:hypothetical protein [Alicyclobacillus sp. SO9]QQE78903.1 hypothetical protein GI364_24240 [Alicyclobacillus sp. SO9]